MCRTKARNGTPRSRPKPGAKSASLAATNTSPESNQNPSPPRKRGWLSRRQGAKTLRLDPQRRGEFAAEILERDGRGQLDDLRLAVMLPEPGEQRVIDRLARDRHALGILERHALRVGKHPAIAPLCDFQQLRLARFAFPHTEGIDVDSEWAAIKGGDAQIDDRQQPFRQL